MESARVLIIDDKMYPNNKEQDKYARKLRTYLDKHGFEVEFVMKGEYALEIIKNDTDKQVKLVFLDIRFVEIETTMQGPEIFKKIQDLRSDIPIVIITEEKARKITGEEDFFREFIELGATLFTEKKYITRRAQEQIDYLTSLIRRHEIQYILKYKDDIDEENLEILTIDIVRRDSGKEYSILKEPHKATGDICIYLEECITNYPNYVHWKKVNRFRKTDFTDIGFHKAVHKLNDKMLRSSGGRLPALLERGGPAGCRLNVDGVEEMTG
jgi:CheY-like chemotaxis protein